MAALRPGTYVVVKTGGFASWLIRVATRSEYNHAFLVTDDEGGIIQAQPSGVVRGNITQYAGAVAAADTAERITPAQRAATVAKAETLLGDGYNWPAIAGDALDFLGWHWRVLLKVAKADKLLVCSQLVAAAGAAAGLDWLCGKTDPSQVTPGDLGRRAGVEPVDI